MARTTGTIMEGVSGRIGGVVFAKNGTARTYRAPTPNPTPRQRQVQETFGALNALWTTVEEDSRVAWQTFASSGLVPGTSSGKALFVSWNFSRRDAGLAALTVPPPVGQTVILDPGVDAVLSATVADGDISMSITLTGFDHTQFSLADTISVYVTMPVAATATKMSSREVLAGVHELDAADITALAAGPLVITDVQQPWGNGHITQQYAIRILKQAAGNSFKQFERTVIVSAA